MSVINPKKAVFVLSFFIQCVVTSPALAVGGVKQIEISY